MFKLETKKNKISNEFRKQEIENKIKKPSFLYLRNGGYII